MKITETLSFSFKDELVRIHARPLYRHPSSFFWRKCLSVNNQFCQAVVNVGLLSWEQMINASCRYCVGTSKNGGVIFWQIDHEGRVHDGKVMYYLPNCHRNKAKDIHPTWVSSILRRRNQQSEEPHITSHCFFGTHLLPGTNAVVCLVEAEKTAFILSEKYPQNLWLAAGGLTEVQPDKFRPLRGRKVIMFPDTDPDGATFRYWFETADFVMHASFWKGSPPIRVSSLLEKEATPDQKHRKIDLIDYLLEYHKQ